MLRIEEPLAGIAMCGPLIFEPCQAATIERFAPRRFIQHAQEALMRNPQDCEDECGDERPGKQARMRARQPDGSYDGDDGERELAETEEPVPLPQACSFCLKYGKPIAIDVACV
jgi:hypothetical protein